MGLNLTGFLGGTGQALHQAGIERDLTKRIQAKAEEKVRKAEVRKAGLQESPVRTATEKQVVEVNAEVLAKADLLNRKDVILALDVSRSQLEEVAILCQPEFKQSVDWLVEVAMAEKAEKGINPNSITKAVELFDYIVSPAGRVRLSKDIAAAFGVYLPMQRKILNLETESDRNQNEIDAWLAKVNASVTG